MCKNSEAAACCAKKGTLAVISGFSGVGKGTIVEALVKRYPYALSVSATTRDKRPGEVPDVSYHYITREAFEEKIAEGDFFEYTEYVGNYYGTPKSFVLDKLAEGKDVILEIESDGALKVRAQYPEALLIYMIPPTMSELKRRLVGRGTESAEKVAKRLHQAVTIEMERARSYDLLIVNQDKETCIEELHRMIQTREGLSPDATDLLDRLEEEGKELGL